MQIEYRFVNETVVVEVDDVWSETILNLKSIEDNRNRSETRRHSSLNGMDYEGELFIDYSVHVESDALLNIESRQLREALSVLSAQQQALLHEVFVLGRSITDIARETGVSKQSIHERLERATKKLKKSLE